MYIMRLKDKKKQFSFGILSLKQINFCFLHIVKKREKNKANEYKVNSHL